MKQIKFGDQESINYVKAKNRLKYNIFDIHECDCELCDAERYICPNCKSEQEPDDIVVDGMAFVKCVECNEKAYARDFDKWRDEKIVKEFEEG